MRTISLTNTNAFNYMMLIRLQSDCDYFLGYGGHSEKVLWGENVDQHIAYMKKNLEQITVRW